MRTMKACVLLIGGLLALAGPACGQTALQRIRGDVDALRGRMLDVRTAPGQIVPVRLADDVRVSARSAAPPGAIAPGAFIGTTAIPQPDGTLSAVEVHVFPESMRGTGEGHRPMAIEPRSTMTNATVTSVTGTGRGALSNTMTNATVTEVAPGGVGRRVTLKYNGGEKTVVIGDSVPVVMIEPGDVSMLVPGAHVVVTASKQLDGTLTSDRVVVGKNGIVPPL